MTEAYWGPSEGVHPTWWGPLPPPVYGNVYPNACRTLRVLGQTDTGVPFDAPILSGATGPLLTWKWDGPTLIEAWWIGIDEDDGTPAASSLLAGIKLQIKDERQKNVVMCPGFGDPASTTTALQISGFDRDWMAFERIVSRGGVTWTFQLTNTSASTVTPIMYMRREPLLPADVHELLDDDGRLRKHVRRK